MRSLSCASPLPARPARSRDTHRASTTSTSSRCPTATPAPTSRRPRARCSTRCRPTRSPSRTAIARVGARAALLGARGNSGIILSQLVRGACDRLGEGGPLDGPAVADALRRASTEADAALREPVEGTILTVARALADGAEAARSDDPIDDARGRARGRRGRARAHARHAARRCARPASSMPEARDWSSSCAARSPRCAASPWPTRRRSGSTSTSRSRPTTPGRATAPASWSRASFPREQLEDELAPLGDCLVVVSDGELVRAHVHTDDPGRALSAATALGALSGVEISDMYEQRDALVARTLAAAARGRRAPGRHPRDRRRRRQPRALREPRRAPAAGRPADASTSCVEAIAHEPGRGHRRAAQRSAPALPSPRSPRRPCSRAGARRAVARARAGPRGARRLPHRSARRGARRGPRGRGRVGAQRRGARAAPTTRRRCARPSRRVLVPGSTLVTVLAGRRRPSRRRSTALATWLAAAHPGVELELHDGGQAHPRYSVSAE